MANIPAESVETVENGVVATHHRAGVGRIDQSVAGDADPRARHQLQSVLARAAESLINKDLIPKMLADSNYLTEHHIHIINKDGQEVPPSVRSTGTRTRPSNYQYKEDPGTENSLGVVRININNPYGVYMHDTSEKGVFGDDNRFVSSGCIRVQNVRDYVQWLLKDTPAWDRPHIDEAIRSGQQVTREARRPGPGLLGLHHRLGLARTVIVQFRDDIYQRDGFSPAVTGSIGRPEPQDGVSKTSYDQGGDPGLDAAPDDH